MEKSRWRWWDERLSPIEKAATILGVAVALLVAAGLISQHPVTPSQTAAQTPDAQSSSISGSPRSPSPSSLVAPPSESTPPTQTTASLTPTPWSYAASWNAGMDGWSATTGWRVGSGTLLSDGTTENSRALPDFLPPTADYVVSADIELVRSGGCFWFGLEARLTGDRGYRAGIGDRPPNGGFCVDTTVRLWDGADAFLEKAFVPVPGVHHYELGVEGTSVWFSVDGSVKLRMESTLNGNAGNAALWSSNSELIVHAFEIAESTITAP